MNARARRLPRLCALLLLACSLVAIVHTWTIYAQTWDENYQISRGMEWLVRHEYQVEVVDPPLPPVMDALGPYLRGSRTLLNADPWVRGNAILAHGNYEHNLYAARAGTLVFFLFAAYLVWSRARDLLGEWGATAALGIFVLLPLVIAHSSLATTDASMLAMFFWAVDRLWRFFRSGAVLDAILAGIASGLAMVSKMTALPTILLAVIVLVLLGWHRVRRSKSGNVVRAPWRLLITALSCGLVIWAMYFFTVGSIVPKGSADRVKLQAALQRHHLPVAPVVGTLSHLPAPSFFQGLRDARAVGKHSGHGWVLGKMRTKPTRWFFPVSFAAKMPIPFTLLFLFGAAVAAAMVWHAEGPEYLDVLLTGAFVPIIFGVLSGANLGIRHILGAVPFAAILAALAVQRLWSNGGVRRGLVVALLAWFAVDAAWGARDPLPWYNEAARIFPHGGAWFEAGSDYDWGQDLKRLPAALAAHHVQHFWFVYNGSADLSRAGLPPWTPLPPGKRVQGWVALSGAYTVGDPARYGWLQQYKPVQKIGTMLLYWIPAQPLPTPAK